MGFPVWSYSVPLCENFLMVNKVKLAQSNIGLNYVKAFICLYNVTYLSNICQQLLTKLLLMRKFLFNQSHSIFFYQLYNPI